MPTYLLPLVRMPGGICTLVLVPAVRMRATGGGALVEGAGGGWGISDTEWGAGRHGERLPGEGVAVFEGPEVLVTRRVEAGRIRRLERRQQRHRLLRLEEEEAVRGRGRPARGVARRRPDAEGVEVARRERVDR